MGWQDDPIISTAQPELAALPPWMTDPIVGLPEQERAPQTGIGAAISAGFQGSATGHILRGKLPDVVLDPHHSTWYERAIQGLTEVVSDLPEMVIGGIGGGAAGTAAGPVGTLVGTGAGAFALPAAIREAYTQALSKGDVTSAADFLGRTAIVLKETGKQALVGGATFGAGGLAARTVGKAIAPAIGEALTPAQAMTRIGAAELGAQYGTMVVAPAALEGKLPEPEDFLNAAIVLGGLKAAGSVANGLRNIWAKTGIPPERVVGDAQGDPRIAKELVGPPEPGAIPKVYQPLADAEVVRESIPDPKADPQHALNIAAVMSNLKGEVPLDKIPNYLNFRYIDTPEQLKQVSARVSEVFEQQIAEARGQKSWDQSMQDARQYLADLTGRKVEDIGVGDHTLDAQVMGSLAMVQRAAADVWQASQVVRAKGKLATSDDVRAQVAAIETLAAVQAMDQGLGAEVARALNARKAARQTAQLAGELEEMLAKYRDDPHTLAWMIGKMDRPEQIAKFARDASKASTWEKVVEAWKAGILSGPTTHIANVIGNTIFAAIRPVVDTLAATIGVMRGAAVGDRVAYAESMGRIAGNIYGTLQGLKLAGAILGEAAERVTPMASPLVSALKTKGIIAAEATAGATKAEQFRAAIHGSKGEVIRTPFTFLQAEDAVFKVMSEQGESFALATRKATTEGLNPLTREFRERVATLTQDPTFEADAVKAAGLRYTFNTDLGEKGKAVQNLVRKAHLELIVPFIRTPSNIAKELVRMTPFAPIVGEWREAIAKGGVERDRALAEIALGSGIMATTIAFAQSGMITGAGSPDKGKQNVKRAAGIQPYSAKVGDTYYSLNRLQPVGTLIGLAADVSEVWDHMTPEESDKIPKMLSVAFANAITNQTFLQGITTLVQAVAEPDRRAAKFFQSYAASVVPALVGQTVQAADPLEREINGMLDAVKARLPGARETLLPKVDVYGEPVPGKERPAGIAPITTMKESDDKVRSEAARLDVSVENAPKKVHLGRATGKIGDVELTPAQKNVFQSEGGKLAHQILTDIVNQPTWDDVPDLVQRRIFSRVFRDAHKFAAIKALPPESRGPLIQQITERMATELE